MLVALISTAVILAVLLAAVVSKVSTPGAGALLAAAVLALWPFTRPPKLAYARAVGWGSIVLELVIVGGLGTGMALLLAGRSAVLVLLADLAAAALFCIFAVVEFAALRRGRRPICACFGARSAPISVVGAGRTALLAVLGAAAAAIFATTAGGMQVSALDLVVALSLGIVLGAILVGADDIADILRPSSAPARRPL